MSVRALIALWPVGSGYSTGSSVSDKDRKFPLVSFTTTLRLVERFLSQSQSSDKLIMLWSQQKIPRKCYSMLLLCRARACGIHTTFIPWVCSALYMNHNTVASTIKKGDCTNIIPAALPWVFLISWVYLYANVIMYVVCKKSEDYGWATRGACGRARYARKTYLTSPRCAAWIQEQDKVKQTSGGGEMYFS